MRLGVSTSFKHDNPADWADKMVKLGLKSVVFPVDSSAPEGLVDEYVKAAHESNLLIAEVGIWRNGIATDEAERRKNLEYSINQMLLADRVGARCCVNVAGSPGPIWDGAYRENFSKEMWNKTVKMVQTIIDEAKPSKSFFSIEPMPWMIPTSPEEYLRLIEDVGRDRFGVHMDIINMINCPDRYFFADEFLDRTFELLGDKIKSCHLKDVLLLEDFTFQLRECACGEGTFDLEHYAELADKCDSDMPMIIEHLKSDEDYVKSVKYVRNRLGV